MMVNSGNTYIGDEDTNVIQTKSFDYAGSNHHTQANTECAKGHQHNHSGLEAMFVRTHLEGRLDGSWLRWSES